MSPADSTKSAGLCILHIYNSHPNSRTVMGSTLGLPVKENGYGLIDDCTTNRTGDKQINGVMLRPDDPDMEKKKRRLFPTCQLPCQDKTPKATPPKDSGRCFPPEYRNQELDIMRFFDRCIVTIWLSMRYYPICLFCLEYHHSK